MAEPSKTRLKILLVDDDKFLLDMYALKFERGGFIVDTAPSGDIALKKLKEGEKPDILLLDVVMPGMDGIELLGDIRKENLAPEASVIMLSNQGQQSDLDRANKFGIEGYIVKASMIPSEVLTEVVNIYHKKH